MRFKLKPILQKYIVSSVNKWNRLPVIISQDPYLEPDDILSVDLQQSVVNQKAIPGCWGILCNLRDLAILEHKAHVVCTVFL